MNPTASTSESEFPSAGYVIIGTVSFVVIVILCLTLRKYLNARRDKKVECPDCSLLACCESEDTHNCAAAIEGDDPRLRFI